MLKGHPTTADAARAFDVSPKTVRAWIAKGIIEEPPTILNGTRRVRIFPPEYMKRARQQLQAHVENKTAAKNAK